MLINRFMPSLCESETDALRRASELHALSSIQFGAEARKVEARVGDLRVIADAAEKRASLRAAEDAMSHMRRGGRRRDDETPDA